MKLLWTKPVVGQQHDWTSYNDSSVFILTRPLWDNAEKSDIFAWLRLRRSPYQTTQIFWGVVCFKKYLYEISDYVTIIIVYILTIETIVL